VEDDEGTVLGAVTPLDLVANSHRSRRKPETEAPEKSAVPSIGNNMIEDALERYGKPGNREVK